MNCKALILSLLVSNSVFAGVNVSVDKVDPQSEIEHHSVFFDGKTHTYTSQKGVYQSMPYSLFSDGSGSINDGAENEWTQRCSRDAMTDVVSCSTGHYNKYTGAADLWFWTDGKNVRISVGGDEYPGTDQYIRVDAHPPVSLQNASSAEIIQMIKGGQRITTRWYDWPYNRAQDASVSAASAAAAYDLMMWTLDHYN